MAARIGGVAGEVGKDADHDEAGGGFGAEEADVDADAGEGGGAGFGRDFDFGFGVVLELELPDQVAIVAIADDVKLEVLGGGTDGGLDVEVTGFESGVELAAGSRRTCRRSWRCRRCRKWWRVRRGG